MINYIIISLAVVCFAGQFAFTKLYESTVKQNMISLLVMLIFTSLTGMILYLCVGKFQVQFSTVTLMWAAMLALIMIPYYIVSIYVISLGSLAIYSMFMMLGGMLVPFFYGIVFLDEKITVGKILGTILLSLFIIMQALSAKPKDEVNSAKSSTKRKYLFLTLCLLIFFINGLTGVVAKAHQISKGATNEISFTIISCALTLILSLILFAFFSLKNRNESKEQILLSVKSKPMCIMFLIGAATYTGNFLHLKAASHVPASIQFPLVSGGVILLSALASAFIFKEKSAAKEWISIAGAFLSTVLFAF